MTPSSDSTHSLVSSGSMSGSWLGSPSLMTGRLRSVATGVPSLSLVECFQPPILPPFTRDRHAGLPTAAGWTDAFRGSQRDDRLGSHRTGHHGPRGAVRVRYGRGVRVTARVRTARDGRRG